MPCYIISYDQVDASEISEFVAAIKAYGTWAHIHETLWAVVSESTATQIRDNLRQHVSSGDRLFVVRSGTAAAWRNVLCKNEWLKKHL